MDESRGEETSTPLLLNTGLINADVDDESDEKESSHQIGEEKLSRTSNESQTVVYNFLLQCTVQRLRGIARFAKMRQALNKRPLVASIFLKLLRMPKNDFEGIAFLREFEEKQEIYADGISEYEDAYEKNQAAKLLGKPFKTYNTVPSVPELERVLHEAKCDSTSKTASKKRAKDSDSSDMIDLISPLKKTKMASKEQDYTISSPSFSVSEFARLVVLLHGEERVRAAFLKSRKKLGRHELDVGVKPDDFWKNAVEDVFNDPSVSPKVTFPSYIESNTTTEYTGIFRDAAKLCSAFQAFKRSFSKIMVDYERSGQNEAEFHTFILHNRARSRENPEVQRLLIVGFIYGIGTPNFDVQGLSLFSRVMEHSGGSGAESGMGDYDKNMGSSAERGRRVSRGSSLDNGRRNSRGSVNLMDLGEKMGELCTTMTERFSAREATVDSENNDQSKNAREELEMETQFRLLKRYEEACDCEEKATRPHVKKMWKEYCESLQKKLASNKED